MSNSFAKVRFQDGTIKYAYYNTTSDILGEKLFNDTDSVQNTHETISCNHQEEPIEIAQHYGKGMTWSGRACRKCGYITFNYLNYRGIQ